MNIVRAFALVSVSLIVCAMSSNLAPAAFAEDQVSTKASSIGGSEPTADQLKNSKDRGIFLKVPGSPAAFEVQKGPNASKTATAKKNLTKRTNASDLKVVKTATIKTTPVKAVSVRVSPVKAASTKATQAKATAKPTKENAAVVEAIPAGSEDSIIKAWLNKSGRKPSYKDGEKMQVSVKARKDCNLVIYDFDGKGTLTQIFPNDFQKENSIKAGETVTIGGDNSSFDFQCGLADGASKQQERLFVFAYPAKEDAPLSVAMTKLPDSPFRSANMSLEQYRKLVNESKVYYARSVKVVPKRAKSAASSAGVSQIETVSDELNTGDNAPNKTELSFFVEK
jgi:hypothetical protein